MDWFWGGEEEETKAERGRSQDEHEIFYNGEKGGVG